MKNILIRIIFWLNAARLHTVPTSFMSWLVPFIFGLTNGGNVYFGILALLGIISVHLGVNLLDDIYDYKREIKTTERTGELPFNKQKGKCHYLLNGDATINQTIIVTAVLFSFASIIGLYLTINCGLQVLLIALLTAILCIFYPISTRFGLGELTVGIVYAPLLYCGTYFVMTKTYSFEVLIISISTGLLTVGLLHTSTMLDHDFDVTTKKITICTIVGNKLNAVIAQGIIMFLAYLNIIVAVLLHKTSPYMLISLFTLPTSILLCKMLILHMKDPQKVPKRTFFMGPMENWDHFVKNKMDSYMIKFLLARNVMFIFTIFICIAKILTEVFK